MHSLGDFLGVVDDRFVQGPQQLRHLLVQLGQVGAEIVEDGPGCGLTNNKKINLILLSHLRCESETACQIASANLVALNPIQF